MRNMNFKRKSILLIGFILLPIIFFNNSIDKNVSASTGTVSYRGYVDNSFGYHG